MRTFCFSILFIIFLFPFSGNSQTCNNWLKLNNQPSFVRVGDLDITGDKITVEAIFNRTAPWSGTDHFQGDLVSKHEGPYDCNYLLRPGSAEIATSTGYYKTPPICEIQLNKTYHVAMVYDGSTLKFYRNGFLMSQVAAKGNLIQNNWPTQIGFYYLQLYSTNLIGYINEVRIWNIARTQTEIQSFIKQSLPSPQTIPGLLAYYTFDNLINKQGNPNWNGTLNGSAFLNEINPNCNIVVDSCTVICPTPSIDFEYQQSICSPKTIKFNSKITGVESFLWTFSNGETNDYTLSPEISFLNYGTYEVQLEVKFSNTCKSTIKKNILIDNLYDNSVIQNIDTSLCFGDSLFLITSVNNLNYCWQTSSGEPPPVSISGYIKPAVSATYFLNVQSKVNNLVVNGDFSSGNIGFLSGYKSATINTTEGEYWVSNNPRSWNVSFNNCVDHSTGDGNMMLINGSPTPSAVVWSQSVIVNPNTNYAFSTWIQSLFAVNPANLQFSINNTIIGDEIIAGAPCLWSQFSTTWNSGDNTKAEIKIINNNTKVSGNDFAIDDIYFGPITFKYDSIRINIKDQPFVKTINDTTICAGEKIILNTIGADNFSWTPSTGLSNIEIANPEAKPSVTTKYMVTVESNEGCSAKDSVTITVNENPLPLLGADKFICSGDSVQLDAGNPGAAFEWQNLYNQQILTTKDSGLHKVKITKNSCSIFDSVYVFINPNPLFSLTSDTNVCKGISVPLSISSSGNYTYQWFPTNGLSNHLIKNPIATIIDTIKYEVTATSDLGCKAKENIVINALKIPIIDLGNDTIICPSSIIVLNAKNDGSSYLWNDGSTDQIIKTSSPGVYFVSVTKDGCTAYDSITVSLKIKPEFTIAPALHSICKGEILTLESKGGDVYQWFKNGENLNTNDPIIQLFPEVSTTYSVIIKEIQCGYSDTLFSEVYIKPLPQIQLSKSNDITCKNPQSQLIVSGGVEYKWSPAVNINNTSISNPIVQPSSDTWYTVSVKGDNECSVKDSIKVLSNFSDGGNFYIPNAFTPNNDGKNDCFGVTYWSPVDFFELSIFNRWGERVFFTRKNECWNGYYKGVLQPEGGYIYIINAKGSCGGIYKKGMFTLLK